MHKDLETILLTEEQIAARIEELGEILTRDYEGKNPVIVGVLNGVVVFYADMVRKIKTPCQMDFMSISSNSGTTSTGRMMLRQDLKTDIRGRHVLILEDIFDTGRSLNYTVELLKLREPASIKICTLLDKPERRVPGVTVKADYVGFTIPDAFVVGYGLDYNEQYRNLPYIGILKPEAYSN